MARSNNYPDVNSPMSNANWSHVPPISMPWGNSNENFPQVVRFTGCEQPLNNFLQDKQRPYLHKRKCDIDTDVPPSKMLISEEYMASQLDLVHISQMYTSHSSPDNPIDRLTDKTVSIVDKDRSESLRGTPFTNRLPSLVLSEELKQLSTPSILPPSLIEKLGSPSKALVVWEPRLRRIPHPLKLIQESDCEANNNNNNNEICKPEADNDQSTVQTSDSKDDRHQIDKVEPLFDADENSMLID